MFRTPLGIGLSVPLALSLCLGGRPTSPQTPATRSATPPPSPVVAAPSSTRGEPLGADAIGVGRIVDLLELNELEKSLPHSLEIKRLRNGAHGQWVVPSKRGSGAHHSGAYYIINKWGDTRMGIGFDEPVDLEGAWLTGQTNAAVSTSGLVVVGYRDGLEVARTQVFRDLDESPSWFAMDLAGVDRVVFEAEAVVAGAGWYGLDDLAFSESASHSRRVLDFEDLDYEYDLSGSAYAGLEWEIGSGPFEDVEAIDQPLTNGDKGAPTNTPPPGSFLGGGGTAPNLVQSFVGAKLFDPGANYIPPDTCGAVGLAHFVEVVNTNLSVYEKASSNRVVNISLATLFGSGGTNPGDPRVVFDPHSQRWFILATNFSDRIYLAVSLSSDPTGSFYTNTFLTSQGSDSGKSPDYETLGVDANGVYTAAAMFSSGATMTIFALDKAPLIAGSPSLGTVTAFRGLPWEAAIQPTVTYGNPGRQYFVSRDDSTHLRLREITPPLTSPTLTDLGRVTIPSHNQPPDANSLGSSVPLDSVDYRPMNSVYRAGSVWTAHAVEVNGRSAIRWYEIDAATQSTVQVGTIDSPDLAFIIPSISVNSRGDAVLGFTGATPTAYAASYFTGRLAGDPAGQVGPPVLFKLGEGPYQRTDGYGRNRWGDYSLTSVDPIDDLTFWTVQEYARTSNDWGTWIAQLEYPGISDCNGNGIDDSVDISSGSSLDCNGNGVPDECDLAAGTSLDCNANGVPDECDPDCNGNGVPDDCDLAAGTSLDCNANGTPDECDIAGGTSLDCNANGVPDECEPDCNSNSIPDDCDIAAGTSSDCNGNSLPDECDIAGGTSLDCNANGVPDECEPDCNGNGMPDDCDIAGGTSLDCNANGVPDECEPDCNGNGVPDDCDIAGGTSLDCNGNGVPDECDIAGSMSLDCNANGIPDECEPDCNGNGIPDDCDLAAGTSSDCNGNSLPDECDIASGTSADCNANGVPDECEPDCNGNGVPDDCDLAAGTSSDCNGNSLPDECDIAGGTSLDCNANGIPDECEPDCNGNGIPDDCDLAAGTSLDCNGNSLPDECDIASGTSADCNANGVPDECEPDCNGNGIPDDCDLAAGTSSDCNGNGVPDECDIAGGASNDTNGNGTPDECECLTQTYCVAAPNSVGPGATISFSGSVSVSANDLVLRATGLPVQQFGIFYYGPNQLQAAFGEGFRCVGGTTTRLPVLSSDLAGNASYALDINGLPPGAGAIAPGAVWNFQFWYRDPAGGSSAFNLTDALEIGFCD